MNCHFFNSDIAGDLQENNFGAGNVGSFRDTFSPYPRTACISLCSWVGKKYVELFSVAMSEGDEGAVG
jgi:hypothetical protein